MKTLHPRQFMLEKIKVQPVTNAELDAAQKKMQKEKAIYVVWPAMMKCVNNIERFRYGKKAEIITSDLGYFFVLNVYDVWDLLHKKTITLEPNDSRTCEIYKITDLNLSEADIRETLMSVQDHYELFEYLDDKKNAYRITSSDEIEKLLDL